jgi:hypothetical protein
LADPNPLQPNVKLKYFIFSRKFQYTVQIIENFDTYDVVKKDKTRQTGTDVNESKNLF